MGALHEEAIGIATKQLKTLHEIVDGGANEGHISRQFLRSCPRARVHAFEPNPNVFPDLAKNTNPWSMRAFLHRQALGANPGTQRLNLASPAAASSIYKHSEEWKDLYQSVKWLDESVEVEVVTLDDYCDEWGLDRIDFLKLDTQGFEFSILAGAERMLSEHRIEYVLCEVLFTPFYKGSPLAGDVLTEMADHYDYFPTRIWLGPPADGWTRHADILFTYRRS